MSAQKLDSRHGVTRLLPWWYVNLGADQKRLVGSFSILGGLIPCLVIAWIASSHASDYKNQIDALVASGKGTKAQLLALSDQMKTSIGHAHKAMIVGMFWAFLVAVVNTRLSTVLTRNWLVALTKMTDEIADGDLSREIVRDNESHIGDIQEAIGKMTASFRATINRIELAAAELRDAAGEMVNTSDEAGNAIGEVAQSISTISEGAAHQVDLVTQTSDVVGEIERSVQDAADHADRAQAQSADTEALTDEGVRRATEVQEAMQSVRETSLATQEMVRSLGEKSTSIDLIVRSITDIAEQTNLLALNAAIEAARAGEQGRGFAVVAEEVRKLAEDAQESAGDIAGLILEVRAQTEQAVQAMEGGVDIVERGFEAVNRNRQTFFDISGSVRALHENSVEISALAGGIAIDASSVRGQIEEVASVAEESSASTEQVSASTEETSAAAQEVTASAHRVAHTAEGLAALAGRFKLTSGPVHSLQAQRATTLSAVEDEPQAAKESAA
jgi:methyl-accepting chemotaxis protein